MSDPPMRLTQRNDGQAPDGGHARLNLSSDTPNQSTSTQDPNAPRVGPTNRYS